MIRDVPNKVINEALRRLRNELSKCDGTEGRMQARRNARRRTLTAMRALRAVLDREYPAIVERKEVKRLAPGSRMKALRRAGWHEVSDDDAGLYAAAGVPVKRVAWTNKVANPQPSQYVNGKGWVKQPPVMFVEHHHELFVPEWAVAIGTKNPTRLRQAKRSNIVKRAVLAEKALSLAGTPQGKRYRNARVRMADQRRESAA